MVCALLVSLDIIWRRISWSSLGTGFSLSLALSWPTWSFGGMLGGFGVIWLAGFLGALIGLERMLLAALGTCLLVLAFIAVSSSGEGVQKADSSRPATGRLFDESGDCGAAVLLNITPVDFTLSPSEEAFRAELRNWLAVNAPGDWAKLRRRLRAWQLVCGRALGGHRDRQCTPQDSNDHQREQRVSHPEFPKWTQFLLPRRLLSEPHALQPAIPPIRNRSQGVLLGVSALLTPHAPRFTTLDHPPQRHDRPRGPSAWSTGAWKTCPGTRARGIAASP